MTPSVLVGLTGLYTHKYFIWIYYELYKNHPERRVFYNVNLSNLENLLLKNLKQTGSRSAFLGYLETHFESFLPDTNHGGAFTGSLSLYVPLCPQKVWMCHCVHIMYLIYTCNYLIAKWWWLSFGFHIF